MHLQLEGGGILSKILLLSQTFTGTDSRTEDNMRSQAEAPRNILCAKTTYGFREKENNQEEEEEKGV